MRRLVPLVPAAAFIFLLGSCSSVGDYNAYQFSDGYVDSLGTIQGTPVPANEVVLPSTDLVDPDLTNGRHRDLEPARALRRRAGGQPAARAACWRPY